jgi:hypothetical protein
MEVKMENRRSTLVGTPEAPANATACEPELGADTTDQEANCAPILLREGKSVSSVVFADEKQVVRRMTTFAIHRRIWIVINKPSVDLEKCPCLAFSLAERALALSLRLIQRSPICSRVVRVCRQCANLVFLGHTPTSLLVGVANIDILVEIKPVCQ